MASTGRASDSTIPVAPGSTCDHAAARAQLERIIGSDAFRNSKRYPALLRHLVERSLEGRGAELKERVLGHEVFGRPAGYDTNADPVVRTSAGEIRRRIAQYYHEAGREDEIRIELPLGSYVPEIHFPETAAVVDAPAVAATGDYRKRSRFFGVFAVAALLAIPAIWWHPWAQPAALQQFWQPVLRTGSSVSLCVARPIMTNIDGIQEDSAGSRRAPVIAWADVTAAARLAGLLEANGQPYQLRRDDRTTLEDLRRGPAIMVGAFNDIWTLRLTDGLQFSFRQDGPLRWIQDSKNPSSRLWSVDFGKKDKLGRVLIGRDYAVISRLLNTRTGKPVISVAGIYGFGTEIVGEYVTNRAFLASLASQAPAGWQNKSAQVVLSVEVIDDHPGPPTVLATHFW